MSGRLIGRDGAGFIGEATKQPGEVDVHVVAGSTGKRAVGSMLSVVVEGFVAGGTKGDLAEGGGDIRGGRDEASRSTTQGEGEADVRASPGSEYAGVEVVAVMPKTACEVCRPLRAGRIDKS